MPGLTCGLIVLTTLATLVAQSPAASQPAGQQPPLTAAAPSLPEDPWPPAGVYRLGKGVTMPRVVKEVKPSYTADAMRKKIQGSILVEAIVQPDGTVGEVRIKRSLDRQYGLDDAAVASVKQWQFVAGTSAGVAVPVLIEVELTFTYGKKR